jgi:hypothetical protein
MTCGIVSDLFGLVRQIIRIHADAVSADKARAETSEKSI